MLTRNEMHGVYVLAPTPFKRSGEFDEASFRENVRRYCEVGVHGIATTGTLGEFHSIPWMDHKRLIQALVEEIKGGVVSVAGCSGINTDEAIMKTRFAQDCGVDAVMNVIPFYTKLTRKECVQYWRDLANECPEVGLIVYNNPITTNFLVDAEIFQEISSIPNICGSKEIIGYTPLATFSHWLSIAYATDLAYMACDPMLVPTMMWNGKGTFSEYLPLNPTLILETYRACERKDWDNAQKLHFQLVEQRNYVLNAFEYYNPNYNWFCALKAAINAFGFINAGYPHRPYLPLPAKVQERAQKIVFDRYQRVEL
ncbi:MAG: dihydrodipicolinate synthase family protein [Candidatus Hodarchaeota archaeon]